MALLPILDKIEAIAKTLQTPSSTTVTLPEWAQKMTDTISTLEKKIDRMDQTPMTYAVAQRRLIGGTRVWEYTGHTFYGFDLFACCYHCFRHLPPPLYTHTNIPEAERS
jgi:hypothetical protein